MTENSKNLLYYGDNLDVMRLHIKDEAVDLVYLDPPFNSNTNYNVLFAEKDGSKAASQIQAFTDTWTWNRESESVYAQIVTAGGKVSDCLQAFRTFLGECDMLAYLVMMAPRLVELRRVMKPTASIYLHCDPTASHYLKLLMDSAFGPINFLNEICWKRTSSHSGSKRWSPIHDVILLYSKSDDYCWNQIYQKYSDEYLENFIDFLMQKAVIV
jgi:adenine specific DNA methylase Mod